MSKGRLRSDILHFSFFVENKGNIEKNEEEISCKTEEGNLKGFLPSTVVCKIPIKQLGQQTQKYSHYSRLQNLI